MAHRNTPAHVSGRGTPPPSASRGMPVGIKPPFAAGPIPSDRIIGRPKGALDFGGAMSQSVLAGADATLFNPAASPPRTLALPDTHVGAIRSIAIAVDEGIATEAVKWTLRVNGEPYAGWVSLDVPLPGTAGPASVAYGADETWIPLPTGAGLTLFFTTSTTSTAVIWGAIHGWSWPASLGMER